MKKSFTRRAFGLAGASAMLAASTMLAHAQSWPQRNITLIVSQPAGNSPDVMARLLADRLTTELKQGVIVENRPGGANVPGTLAVTRATPDGYTFLFATTASIVSNVFLVKGLAYDPLKDLAPVAFIVRSNQVLVVNPEVKAKTLPELIALDKQSPGKLSIAVDGPRALAGITAQALNQRAGTKLVPVPYPNVNAGVQDVVAGRVEAGVFSQSLIEPLVRDGKLRALAGAATTRPVTMPEVATMAESVPGIDFSGWFMVMAPAGTPQDIIDRMNAAINTAMKDEKIGGMLPKMGFEGNPRGPGSPADAAKFLAAQMEVWRETTKALGLEPQ
jgi:tripartite-type tricarboxylate transporter receptor subunit TctC